MSTLTVSEDVAPTTFDSEGTIVALNGIGQQLSQSVPCTFRIDPAAGRFTLEHQPLTIHTPGMPTVTMYSHGGEVLYADPMQVIVFPGDTISH